MYNSVKKKIKISLENHLITKMISVQLSKGEKMCSLTETKSRAFGYLANALPAAYTSPLNCD